MASTEDFDPFTVITAGPESLQSVYGDYEKHSGGHRTYTDSVLAASIRARHREYALTITPTYQVDLLAFAAAGHADVVLDQSEEKLLWRYYIQPATRLDGGRGGLGDRIIFAKYFYRWQDKDYIVYAAEGDHGGMGYNTTNNDYILSKPASGETTSSQTAATDALIMASAAWGLALHDEILVFDQGRWMKNRQLWESVQKADWKDVILDGDMKQTLIDDLEGFFDERDSYKLFGVPWKRGIIFHGPPGNGKTISIKAIMKSLYSRPEPVPTLYVKSLVSFGGPQYAIRQIFVKARAVAPCLLVFEDLDSFITDSVRSYFFNEVDGLESNDGIEMVGSTNHLDRLDPGIAKRPSRFDRKYLFPLPSMDQRVQYCEYWRQKLKSNHEISFPRRLSVAIAEITDQFSFAYLKEAFVASLLVIVSNRGKARKANRNGGGDSNGDLDDLILWTVIQKQVKILREEMDLDAGRITLA
ncbi:MAG: hypothetical protein M1827_007708 [Pycnora praestabilis]|nr:MAG: hypothetical protein M1827_007708 [Pycnora praestabilis]